MKEEIINVLEQYDLGNLKNHSSLSTGWANENYKIETDQGTFLYRICKQQPLEYIIFETKLLELIKEIDFPSAYIFKRKDGEYISDSPSGRVMIYEFVSGHEPEANPETVGEIARAIARLNSYKNWSSISKKNSVHIDACKKLIEEFDNSPFQYPEIFKFFKKETEYLWEPLHVDLPKGIVHGDAFTDNTIYDGNKLKAIIDFEEACIDHYIFDVGIAFNGFCFNENNELDEELFNVFLLEYNKIRPMEEKEWELLPYYIEMGAFGMVLWHVKNTLLVREHDKSLARVNELIERIQKLKEKDITSLIEQVQVQS